jgi:hypothetical protein
VLTKGPGWEEMESLEFSEFGFDNLRDSGDIKVIVGGMVGDIPMSIEDSSEGCALDIGYLGICPLKNNYIHNIYQGKLCGLLTRCLFEAFFFFFRKWAVKNYLSHYLFLTDLPVSVI